MTHPNAPTPTRAVAPPRPDPRQDPLSPAPAERELSPRERAALRAQQLRDHASNLGDDGADEFFIAPEMIPDGWSYEWKVRSVLGQEDPAYQIALLRKGWEPVPLTRHPEMMPAGHTGNEITRKGLVLMERPLEITKDARDREALKARAQVRIKEEQLNSAPPGQFQREHQGSPMAKVQKAYAPIPIPEE